MIFPNLLDFILIIFILFYLGWVKGPRHTPVGDRAQLKRLQRHLKHLLALPFFGFVFVSFVGTIRLIADETFEALFFLKSLGNVAILILKVFATPYAFGFLLKQTIYRNQKPATFIEETQL